MKKILTSLIIILTLFGCQDNIQSSLPAFVGLKNGDFAWRSSSSTVVVDASGVLTFAGSDGYGTLTLQIPTVALGTFVLGANATALVTYSEDEFLFSHLSEAYFENSNYFTVKKRIKNLFLKFSIHLHLISIQLIYCLFRVKFIN